MGGRLCRKEPLEEGNCLPTDEVLRFHPGTIQVMDPMNDRPTSSLGHHSMKIF